MRMLLLWEVQLSVGHIQVLGAPLPVAQPSDRHLAEHRQKLPLMRALDASARNPVRPDHHLRTLLPSSAQIDRILIQLAHQLTTLTLQTLLQLGVLKRLNLFT